MIEALSPQQLATRDKRCLKDFSHPAAMRELVKREYAFERDDNAIVEKLREAFPDVERMPSPNTVQFWRCQARREADEERLSIVSQVLWKSANKAVPKAVASLYGALVNAYALMETATERGDDKVRLQAQRNVGDLGEKLLNQFRGGPPEGASPIDPNALESQAIRSLLLSGKCGTEDEARALFLGLSETVQAALPGEGEGAQGDTQT